MLNQTSQPTTPAARGTFVAGVQDKRPTQVERELAELESDLTLLGQKCDTLRDRLQNVLGPSSDPGNIKPGSPREILVPLAETIRNLRDTLRNNAIDVVRDIIERLEIP